MLTFITSDHHFSHANIIKYGNRPFASVEEMDAALVDKWNAVVGKDDVVIHLGDFTLGDAETARKFFLQLNGRIGVLNNFWHHDKRWILAGDYYSASGLAVNLLPPIMVLEDYNNPVVLCHYPLAEWDRKHYGAFHFHGHSHGTYRAPAERILDVGVDCTAFAPITVEEAIITVSVREETRCHYSK